MSRNLTALDLADHARTETAEVMAIDSSKNNAELIADCARLGYLRADWHTLDPTYGLGVAGRGRMMFLEQESTVEWDRDETHEEAMS